VESEIKSLEESLRKDDLELASNYDKHLENAAFFEAYERKKRDLDGLMAKWEDIQLEIELIS
jgi:ATP-binding cassette subfamily F protein 3